MKKHCRQLQILKIHHAKVINVRHLQLKNHKVHYGFALLVLILIISIASTTFIYSQYSEKKLIAEREEKTTIALNQAKEALIYYSLNSNLYASTCTSSTNCPRPGDLPCPDRTNDGLTEPSCGSTAGSNQAFRLNRLPWRNLGLGNLTDGNGERLWYAVSNNYKYNTRTRPLNSNTLGTITVRDHTGNIIHNASTGGGVVAVIISAGNPITRQDGYAQNRNAAGANIPNNYLDIANGEDNSNFTDLSSNGFIVGPVKDANGNIISNDRLVVITRDEMNAAMQAYVLSQVRAELLSFYAANQYFPYPAVFTDSTCTPTGTNVDINSGCNSVALNYEGRIPVSNINPLSSNWPTPPSAITSLLKGVRANNWFQQNRWRELIYYAIAPDCEFGTIDCSGSTQRLTLNNAMTPPNTPKNVVLISAGKTIGSQSRTSLAQVAQQANYFEEQNTSLLDFDYNRAISNTSNDFAMSIP